MNTQIADLETYTIRMNRGMMDKLFFVDKIDADLIVDYGCATGDLLSHVASWFPNATLIGYDIDQEMLALTKTINNCTFTDVWPKSFPTFGKKALVLSSILHELYHYKDHTQIESFWEQILGSEFDYLVIRDMMPSRSVNRPSHINDVARVYQTFLNSKELQDFENIWGTIEDNRNLLHFLLKYRYHTPNWEREVRENYIPIYREDLLSMIPKCYRIIYHEHYVLPYIQRTIREDVGVELKDPTHLKIILERV